MSANNERFESRIQALADRLLDDYGNERFIDRLEMFTQPDRHVIEELIGKLLRLVFPGYFRDYNYRIYNPKNNLSALIEDIARNADFAADAIGRADEAGLREAVRRSWDLNRALDAGTFPDSIKPFAAVLDRHGAVYKLLGAGGGGFLLVLAPDAASASAIRSEILAAPPNPGTRFVTPSLSRGLQITRS